MMRNTLGTTILALVVLLTQRVAVAADWFDATQIGGDLRYRLERTDKDGSDVRNRHRLRLRLGLKATVNSNVTAEVRFATGSTAPYTSDQTLGEGFISKNINLDRACFDWRPEAVKGMHIIVGKMANPFITGKGLAWDGDVTPEGMAVKYAMGGEIFRLLASGGGFWVEERSADKDSMLYAGQIAADTKAGPVGLLVGVGFYSYDNMQGYPVIVDDGKGFGNSTDPVTDENGETTQLLYANEYNEIEGFVEVSAKIGSVPCKGRGHCVVNAEADADDTGYLMGVQMGKAKEPGSFQLDYDWRELEADAVVGALTDSNVWGGGTDGRGHRVYLTYQIANRWQLGLEYFASEIGLDDSTDYSKFRAELKAKF